MKYCTIIPVKASDYYLVEPVCKALVENFSIEDIYIITNKNCIEKEMNIQGVHTIDEDDMYPGLSFQAVKELMASTDYLDPKYTGHCFQQLLKLAFCFNCKEKGYLVWDADTIPLREIPFYDDKNDVTTFHMKTEYVKDYFDNLKTVLDVDKQIDKSFISEHMYFDASIVKEMIDKIENKEINGNSWWEKIVLAMPCGNGVSEYEMYGNYMLAFHPEKCKLIDANSLRYGINVLGKNFDDEKKKWIGRRYDTVSFENWDKETFLTNLSNTGFVKHFDAKKYASVISFINRGINRLRR